MITFIIVYGNVCLDEILICDKASESIKRKEMLYKQRKILKDKKNKWSTIAGKFNTTFVTEIILKLLELYHSAEIYATSHLTDKLLITI